ncbi:hypothetical protein NPIL_364561 [Nephila pilipes]|uniref:Uncharacterized protein n=1 Tax=Nephila pilipes TaxID=299642 RepID=A0A8X6P417_NEPPI|nr:hypothetical protein NPIL_364561 [Nephila pilipes]
MSQLSSLSENGPSAHFQQNGTNNGSIWTPVVHSILIYRICLALEFSVELAYIEKSSAAIQTPQRKMANKAPLPAFYSTSVFKI